MPFPSDQFTVRDQLQQTRRRIALPLPNCSNSPSDCEDIRVLNTLDGFSLQPRLSIPFDGPIDVTSVNSATVFVVPADSGHFQNHAIGIDRIVWDPANNTVYAKSDEVLDQHSTYALIVTDGVRDNTGRPVQISSPLVCCKSVSRNAYTSFQNALATTVRTGIAREHIVAATLFTTQSVTTALEKIEREIANSFPAPARFDIGPSRTRALFTLADIVSLKFNGQTGANPVAFTRFGTFFSSLGSSVSRIAFGNFVSPDYLTHPGEYFAPITARRRTQSPERFNQLFFNLYLPSGVKPLGGWPIAIYSHGGDDNKNMSSMLVAGQLASHGIATIAINAVGHGFGPQGTLVVALKSGATVMLPAGGRGIDQDGNGVIAGREGLLAMAPRKIIGDRDGFRQTVIDLMQLVRVIGIGVDVDGDGSPDLDASHIYYYGHSLGAMWGTMFLALEPNVRSGVLMAPGGPRTTTRLNTIGGRNGYGVWLASRTPSLINAPGITRIDGAPVSAPFFDERPILPFGVTLPITTDDGQEIESRSPVTDPPRGAIAIDQVFEHVEWAMQSADAVVYARYLRKDPLPHVQPKNILIQFARTDQTTPNFATAALVRNGDLADRTVLYRHDLAYADKPALPKNPHGFPFLLFFSAAPGIPQGVLEQIAQFFASQGATIIRPKPERYFEVPVSLPLPADTDYIP